MCVRSEEGVLCVLGVRWCAVCVRSEEGVLCVRSEEGVLCVRSERVYCVMLAHCCDLSAVRDEGVIGLWKGLSPGLLRHIGECMCNVCMCV